MREPEQGSNSPPPGAGALAEAITYLRLFAASLAVLSLATTVTLLTATNELTQAVLFLLTACIGIWVFSWLGKHLG